MKTGDFIKSSAKYGVILVVSLTMVLIVGNQYRVAVKKASLSEKIMVDVNRYLKGRAHLAKYELLRVKLLKENLNEDDKHIIRVVKDEALRYRDDATIRLTDDFLLAKYQLPESYSLIQAFQKAKQRQAHFEAQFVLDDKRLDDIGHELIEKMLEYQ